MNERTPSREKILAVARSLFARYGYRGTSIRAIIGEAHVNLGAVTYHFGGKPGLYAAVVDSLVDPLEERIRAAVDAPGPGIDRVEQLVLILLDHLERNPDQAHIILHELALQRPLPERVRRWIVFLYTALTGLIRDGQADGTIAEGPPGLLAASVVAQPFYFAMTGPHLADVAGLPVSQGGSPDIAVHLTSVVRRLLGAARREP
jgi:AcrR family transcriptional regulator